VGDGAAVGEVLARVVGADLLDDLGEGQAGALGDVQSAEGGVEEVLEEQFVHAPALWERAR
jgi:hypothetical protein